MQGQFPTLDHESIGDTRRALHAYAKILGAWLKAVRSRRKHWWHASLRPSLNGLSTGVVRTTTDFELELDLLTSRLVARVNGKENRQDLTGQSAASLAAWLDDVLLDGGVDRKPAPGDDVRTEQDYAGYSRQGAAAMHGALASVARALEELRAGIREETSPIQVWPHHFDLSMIWLPGAKIPGQDPADEEYADKQMNFGFVFGDDSIREPYLYVTAYPLPETLPSVELPAGTAWQSEGFSGAALRYADLVSNAEPDVYLSNLWTTLLDAAKPELAENN